MGKKPVQSWHLDPSEVTWSANSLSSGARAAARESRAKSITAYRMELVHIPTGTKVFGEVPEGHYTRKQMKDCRAQLWTRLFAELELKVAFVLHLPGR